MECADLADRAMLVALGVGVGRGGRVVQVYSLGGLRDGCRRPDSAWGLAPRSALIEVTP